MPFRNGKKKQQKDKDSLLLKRELPKAAELKGPHRDVMQMKELLIGALYLFPSA